MTLRSLTLFFCSTLIATSMSLAQYSVPDSQLTFIGTELKQAYQELTKKVAAINYQDPGPDKGWRVSQAAWEKMESRIGFPPPTIEKMLDTDPAKRTGWQNSSIKSFYLGMVNEKTKPELRPLVERVELLQFHKRGGEKGITDTTLNTISNRFWKRRLVDTYRATTKDNQEKQKLVIKFLNRAALNFADDGRLDNLTDRHCRDCQKKGCKDPLFLTVSYHLKSYEQQKRQSKAQKELPELAKQLNAPKYPRVIKVLARMAQSDLFRTKNIVNGKELDKERADQIAKHYNDSILAMLKAESKCPENIEPLDSIFDFMASNFRDSRHCIALSDSLKESKLHEGFKQAALQRLASRIARSRDLEVPVRQDYMLQSFEHGESAAELIRLSTVSVQQLVSDTASSSKPEVFKKWFDLGTQRAPGRYSLYRRYMWRLGQIAKIEKRTEFALELLRSDNFSAGVPLIGVRLINEGVGGTTGSSEKGIRDSKEVIEAFENVINQASNEGVSTEWCTRQRQFLNHMMMQAGYFEDALRIGKELKGEFGSYNYRGQKLTIALIAKLCNPFAREIQETIDAGTFDPTKADQTIEKLTEIRMDMGTDEGTYIDDLLDLIRAIEAFESGEWAELTTKKASLSHWQDSDRRDNWKVIDNGLSTGTNDFSVTRQVVWRWRGDSEYILEADIEIEPMKSFSQKWGASAGFGISNGRHSNVPAMQVMLNPHKATALIHAFRDKKFSAKEMLNAEGPNRLRMRVWKDYCEFTINGKIAGQYAMPCAIPGHIILKKSNGAARTKFTNVRVRQLNQPSPIGERLDEVFYWVKRLKIEPDCKDVQAALEKAKAKQNAGADNEKAHGLTKIDSKPISVKDGLVARWAFDNDLSESVSNTEAKAALETKMVEGKVGRSLQLSQNNSSNLIVTDGPGPIEFGKPFTVSFWARWQTEDGILIAQTGERAGLLVHMSDGDLRITHRQPGLTISSNNRGKLPLKTWRHITITYDGSNSAEGIGLFVEGKKRTNSFFSGWLPKGHELPPMDSSNTRMHFGCDPFGNTARYGIHAAIDELRVYDRKLSDAEIKQVMSYGLK